MAQKRLYYKNMEGEPEELEELEDDPEFKELGDEDLEETGSPDGADEEGALEEEESEAPETE